MILTSFNIWGLGSGPKHTSLKHFLETNIPGIVMLQETIMSSSSSRDFFLKISPYWRVCAYDVVGQSRGTLIS